MTIPMAGPWDSPNTLKRILRPQLFMYLSPQRFEIIPEFRIGFIDGVGSLDDHLPLHPGGYRRQRHGDPVIVPAAHPAPLQSGFAQIRRLLGDWVMLAPSLPSPSAMAAKRSDSLMRSLVAV